MLITIFRAVSPSGDTIRMVHRPHGRRHRYAVIIEDEGYRETWFSPHLDRGHAIRTFVRQSETLGAALDWSTSSTPTLA